MMTESRPSVMVALDSASLKQQALELGARMAVREGRQLTVLVVENIELCRAAELPFAREIDRLSGVLQPLDLPRLEALLKRRITQIHHWLVEIETRLALPSGLEIRRGRYLETALAAVQEGDLLIFGTYREWLSARRLPVWVWYDGGPLAERALALGRELAREENCRLMLAGTVTPLAGEFITTDPNGFLNLVERQGCTAVICPRTSPLAGQLPLRAPCPVILV